MTRDEALKILEMPMGSEEKLRKEKESLMNSLGISMERGEAFMTQPVRSHEEFDTNKRILQFMGLARRVLKR